MPIQYLEGKLTTDGLSFGIVVSRFNEFITKALLDGALDALRRHGVDDSDITVAWVPGAFEIPLVAMSMARSGRCSAVIALGCVIRGATGHYDQVANTVASGLSAASLESMIPVSFGVLTVESIEQGIERAGSKAGNKGAEAAVVAIEMANLTTQLK